MSKNSCHCLRQKGKLYRTLEKASQEEIDAAVRPKLPLEIELDFTECDEEFQLALYKKDIEDGLFQYDDPNEYGFADFYDEYPGTPGDFGDEYDYEYQTEYLEWYNKSMSELAQENFLLKARIRDLEDRLSDDAESHLRHFVDIV